MNSEQKMGRQRKASLHRVQQSCSANKQSRQRSSSSVPKKNNAPILAEGSYLLAWGQIPSRSPALLKSETPIKIGKNVTKYSCGEKHIVFINNKNQAYGLGDSSFGQLGYFASDSAYQETLIPIMEELTIQSVFCTPYSTFLITNRDQIYACGLNNRGQLGVGHSNPVKTPTKITSLSKRPILNFDKVSSSKLTASSKNFPKHSGRIQSYALAEKNNASNQSKIMTERSEQNKEHSHLYSTILLEENQQIVCIEGGPYHTIALSNRGRVFYSGNVYKKSSILNDQFASNFTELNLKKIGKVHKIKAGLTSVGLLSSQGSLFILGALNEHIISDEPYNTGISGIADFGICHDRIYVCTEACELFCLLQVKKSLKMTKFSMACTFPKIKQINSGIYHSFFIDNNNSVYVSGNHYLNNIQGGTLTKLSEDESMYSINFDNLQISNIKNSMNFGMGLCERAPVLNIINNSKKPAPFKQNNQNQLNHPLYQRSLPHQRQKAQMELLKKITELEKQNKVLQEQLMERQKQNQRSPAMNNTEGNEKRSNMKNNKFDINFNIDSKIGSKVRTFDCSMEIPFEELELEKQISEGGYGIIYKAKWRKTTVAVKIFKIDSGSDNSIRDFISECHAMESLRHPNIVMFLGACTKAPNFAIVLEYCGGGTLWSVLQNKSSDISWEQRRSLALQIAKGMNYLHQKSTPILHRDLKSLNILLDENKQVKLADFGWTKGLQNYMTAKIGTYQWMAPEVVSSHQYTEKADVFSFAIILWEIASREPPYRNIPGAQIAQDVLHKDLRPTIPKRTPQPFSNLMKQCWGKNPEGRPSFSQIIEKLQKMLLPSQSYFK